MERSAPSIDAAPAPVTAPPAAGRGAPSRDLWPAVAALAVLVVIALVTALALRDVPTPSERAAAEVVERERVAAEKERVEREQAERALAEAEALAEAGDHLAARDAFLEIARAGGELAAVALERARESGAVYVEAATVRLEQLLAEERTAEALAHLQETLAELRDTPEVELFLDGARELLREAAAQFGPVGRALLEVLRDAASG